MWDLHGHLLAAIFDVLAAANWQRGGDENAKKPEQLERPGVKKKVDGRTLAHGKAVPIEDMEALLGWGAPPIDAEPPKAIRKRNALGRFCK